MDYSFQDLINRIEAIKSHKNKEGKKNHFGVQFVSKQLFKRDDKFLTNLKESLSTAQRDKISVNNFLYKNLSFDEIVSTLNHEFDFIPAGEGVKIKHDSVEKFLEKSSDKDKEKNEKVYLVASTYQGEPFEVEHRGIFEIEQKTKKATFFYYKSSESEPVILNGALEIRQQLLYLTFRGEGSRFVQKMYILKISQEWQKSKYIMGTYIGDDTRSPMAGQVCCEIVKTEEEAKEKLGSTVLPAIQYILLDTQIKFTSEGRIPYYKMVEGIKKYCGFYRGFYLSGAAFKKIMVATMEIKEDGQILFYNDVSDTAAFNKGHLYLSGRDSSKEVMYCRFHLNPEFNIYKFIMTLRPSGANKDFLVGFYGGGYQNPEIPESGRVIFAKENMATVEVYNVPVGDAASKLKEKYPKNFQNILKFLRGEKVSQFHNDVVDSPYEIFKDTPHDHPKNTGEPFKVENFEYYGNYTGFIIQHFDREPNYRLQEILFSFKKNGHLTAESKQGKYSGQVTKSPDSKNFKFVLLDNDKTELFYHFIEFDMEEGEILYGTYAGIRNIGGPKDPIGGRITLYKDKNSVTANNRKPKDYDLKNLKDVRYLQETYPDVLPFFMGINDNMIESYKTFYESNLLPRFYVPAKEIKEQVSGTYKVFRLRNRRSSISIVPMVINEDGSIFMKSSKYEDNKKIYKGKAVLVGEMLYLFFFRWGDSELHSYAIFNKSIDAIGPKNNIIIGLFSSYMPHEKRTFSSRMILIFEDKKTSDIENSSMESIEVPTPTWGKPPSKEYIYYNEKHLNIMTYLTGEENNMIRSGRGPKIRSITENNRFEKKYDYGLVFFMAAVQAFKENDQVKAREYWKHAKDQGFNDISYYNKLLSEIPGAELLFL